MKSTQARSASTGMVPAHGATGSRASVSIPEECDDRHATEARPVQFMLASAHINSLYTNLQTRERSKSQQFETCFHCGAEVIEHVKLVAKNPRTFHVTRYNTPIDDRSNPEPHVCPTKSPFSFPSETKTSPSCM